MRSPSSELDQPSLFVPSATFEVSEPNLTTGTENTGFIWTVTYKDASQVSLTSADVRLVGASSGCQVTIQKQSSLVYQVVATGCSANGYLGIVIESGSARNLIGEQTQESSLSSLVKVNNSTQMLSASFASPADMIISTGSTQAQSLQVNLSAASGVDIFIDYTIAPTLSTATSADHSLVNGTVKIPAGQTSALINFNYLGSSVGSKILQVALQGGTGKGIVVNTTENIHRRLLWDSSQSTYADLSAGNNHVCAVTTDGDLKCWGSSSYGALGIANKTFLSSPTVVDAGQKYIAVAAGPNHTCAITDGQRVKCWGRNNYGQLGDENLLDAQISTPHLISDTSTYATISTGNDHSCGVTTDGYLKCWGWNNKGQLGKTINTTTNPIATRIDTSVLYKSVAAANQYSCGVTTANVLKCWGLNYSGQLSGSTGYLSTTGTATLRTVGTYKSVTAKDSHTCATNTSDVAYCWGANGYGRLGNSSTTTTYSVVAVNGSDKYTQIAVGSYHSCGITDAGSAKCWGLNSTSQLGGSTGTQSLVPVLAESTKTYSKMASGQYFTCAITSTGLLECWGNDGTVAEGVSTNQLSKVDIATELEAQNIIAATSATCIINTSGNLYCSGTGSLGDGQSSTQTQMVHIDPFEKYKSITGESHFCGITLTGKLKCWGINYNGQVGNGTTTEQLVPVYVDENETYIQVSTGNSHTCALTKENKLKCWGSIQSGRIGDPAFTTDVLTPQPIDANESYSAISAGGSHTCGVTVSKKLKCWGYDYYGQLGDGADTQQDLPIEIDGSTEYTEVSLGYNFTCARTTAGIAKCFGENYNGQIGTGSTASWRIQTPQAVSTSETFSQISAKNNQVCGLTASGQLFCWGKNENGELGDGTGVAQSSPTLIQDGSYTKVSVGESHICGIRTDGKVRCSGVSSSGRFGFGNLTNKPAPVSP